MPPTTVYNSADFDSSTFNTDSIYEVVDTSWGREIIFTNDSPYAGKELQIDEGQELTIHVSDRFRTFYLREGDVVFEIEDMGGNVHEIEARSGIGYRIQNGQKFGIRANSYVRIVEAYMPDPEEGEVEREKFSVEPYVKRVEKPWGYELHWAMPSDPLMAKIMHIDEHKRQSEQVHDIKEETYLNIWGNGQVVWDDVTLSSQTTHLDFDHGYRTHVGQKHRLGALEGGIDILEISTPESGTTWRLADDFARPDETPEQRKIERGEV